MMLTVGGSFQYGLKLDLERIHATVDPAQGRVNERKRHLRERQVKENASGWQGKWILTLALTVICQRGGLICYGHELLKVMLAVISKDIYRVTHW